MVGKIYPARNLYRVHLIRTLRRHIRIVLCLSITFLSLAASAYGDTVNRFADVAEIVRLEDGDAPQSAFVRRSPAAANAAYQEYESLLDEYVGSSDALAHNLRQRNWKVDLSQEQKRALDRFHSRVQASGNLAADSTVASQAYTQAAKILGTQKATISFARTYCERELDFSVLHHTNSGLTMGEQLAINGIVPAVLSRTGAEACFRLDGELAWIRAARNMLIARTIHRPNSPPAAPRNQMARLSALN